MNVRKTSLANFFRIYNPEGECVGATLYAEDAAMFAGMLGNGSKVCSPRGVRIWTEGEESFSAEESYDNAADVMRGRMYGGGV